MKNNKQASTVKHFVTPAVHHASTILFDSFEQLLEAKQSPLNRHNMYYGRVGTPTTHMLEDAICYRFYG